MKELNHKITSAMPFQDMEACKRVRAIKKEDICKHSNPDFKIRALQLRRTDFFIKEVLTENV
jgi:hypothetical protein